MRIALVTEEIAVGSGSGGIGGAFHELSLLLAREGHDVQLVYAPTGLHQASPQDVVDYYLKSDIEVVTLQAGDYLWETESAEARSYAVFCLLKAQAIAFDFVHFHDYKGLGFFCVNAKAQRLAFAETTLVVQAHGPTRWTLESNGHPFTHEDQIKIDFLERGSIARADLLISPSRYLLGWFKERGWALPPASRVSVIQNVCLELDGAGETRVPALVSRPDEIILFARHEARKGILPFCDALDELGPELASGGVQVTFLGPLGQLEGERSLVYLAHRARRWAFPLAVLPDMGRKQAAQCLLSNPRSLVVVPSPVENSPYTVLEAASLGKPLLTSSDGGAGELLDAASAQQMTCRITGPELARTIRRMLAEGAPVPGLACAPEATRLAWLRLHQASQAVSITPALRRRLPKVTAAITHHERPEKLYDALLSLARQTYPNLDILIVDDGSSSEGTLRALERMQPLIQRLGARLVRRSNGYLGAARNTAIKESKSDYIIFLDDDDIAFPTMVSTLVEAAEATRADIMGCLNLFMEVERRGEAHPFPDQFPQKASYVPLGGPLACAPLANVFGSATSLIRRSILEKIGGYTEEHSVGHEDFELYVRALQQGARLEICPVPLYLYEVGRPSMSSTTSKMRNWRRVAAAVEVGAKPSCWADLVMLTAGQRAAAHTENFRVYARSVSKHGALLDEIDALPPEGTEYALKVASFAQQLGAASFARAMLNLSRRRSLAEAQPSVDALPVGDGMEDILLIPAAPPPSLVRDQHILAALVDVQLRRFDEAMANFRLSLERGRLLTPEHQRLLSALLEHAELTPADLRPFVALLPRLTRLDTGNLRLLPLLFRLALRAGDTGFAQRIVSKALDLDCTCYLQTHSDVASFADGNHGEALRHYTSFGVHEARAGFERSNQLVAVLREELAVESTLQELAAAVAALQEVPIPPGTPEAMVTGTIPVPLSHPLLAGPREQVAGYVM